MTPSAPKPAVNAKTLLVADDPSVLGDTARHLETNGFSVVGTGTVGGAAEYLHRERFDLVVAAIGGIKSGNLEIVELVKRRSADTAVIVFTPHGDVQAALDAIAVGADDYVAETSDPEELLARIASTLERRRLKGQGTEPGKEALLRELRHRFKNNLATVMALIDLQAANSAGDEARETMAALKRRVWAILLVYEKATSAGRVDLRDYAESLSRGLARQYARPAAPVDVDVDIDIGSIHLDIDTCIPLGLIAAELVSNALLHAFPEERSGRVRIRAAKEGSSLTLTVQDDGAGLPEGVADSTGESLGLRFIRSLTDQLDGGVEFHSNHGTTVVVQVPVAAEP